MIGYREYPNTSTLAPTCDVRLRAFYSDFLLHSILAFLLHGARSWNSASIVSLPGRCRAGIADSYMDAAHALSPSLQYTTLAFV